MKILVPIISDCIFSNTSSNLNNKFRDSIQGRYIKNKKAFLLFAMILCSFNISLNAQCDETSDVIQNTSNTNVSFFNSEGNTYGNTFTPTCSGKVEGISFWTREAPGSIGGISMTVELYRDPLGNNPQLLASQTNDIPFDTGNRERYFIFDDEPNVVSGNSYGFRITRNDTQHPVKILLHNSNPYSGGRMFLNDFDDDNITQNWDLRFQIHYLDEVPPEANCKNITRALGANNTLSLNASAVNNGSTDADSGIAFATVSPNTFDCNDVGYNRVTFAITDQNGNTSTCESVVMITDGNAPVLTCPGDITVTADITGTAIVNYADILYDDCTFEWENGFDFLGTYDGKSYFLSQDIVLPSEAFTAAEAIGAHLATIVNQEHNDFIRAAADNLGVPNNLVIGYNDIATEGTFVWHSGSNSSYTNWNSSEPNNVNNEDYTYIRADGEWNDIHNNAERYYVIEKSEPNIRQTSGIASGGTFPEGDTINFFSATDAFGNTGTCHFIVTVLPAPEETSVELVNGKLIITDIENDSDDQITLSNDGTTLTISDLILPLVSGGPTLVDPSTVTVPLASITNGIEFNSANGSNNGFNIITFADDLTLTGVDNDITLLGLKGYVQNGSINTEGDVTINGIGFNLTLGEITANNFTIDGVDKILDQDLALTISGVTQLQAGDAIGIEFGQFQHTFGGEVNLTSGELVFTAGSDTTFGEVTTTDQGIAALNTLTVNPGDITFNKNVTILGTNSNLFVCGVSNITQTSTGIIEAPFLILRGFGGTTVSLDQDNNIQALGTENPANENGLDLATLSFNNINNMFLEVIDVNEFDLTAPEFDFEPGVTNITKDGTGISNFNANIDVNNGTGTARINHNGGTINFNGDTNDFLSQMTYTGQSGTITNMNSLTTNFPVVGADRGFTFGTLNAKGNVNTSTITLNIEDGANFYDATTSLTGRSQILGAVTTISDNAEISPSGESNYRFNDLIINTGATYKASVQGTVISDYNTLDVIGTVTLDDANLELTGGFVIGSNDEILIIENDGTDPVVGTFNGLPEGSEVVFGDFIGIISYLGGDGNDIALYKPETEVRLLGGALSITDINGGVSNDDITLSNDGTTLTISNLIAPVKIVGEVTSVSETSVSVPIASIVTGFLYLPEDGVNSITINDDLTLSGGSTSFFIAEDLEDYTQNAALTVGNFVYLTGTNTSSIVLGEITAEDLFLDKFNGVDDSEGRLNISGNVGIKTSGILNINNGRGNESNHFFGGNVDLEAARIWSFTSGSDINISRVITSASSNGVNNIIVSPGAITISGDITTVGDSDINISSTTSINQLANATITTDELTISTDNDAIFLSETNDINVLTTDSSIQNLVITDIDDLELGTIAVDEFTITAPSINMTSQTDFTKFGTGEGSFIGNTTSTAGTGTITHDGGTIVFNGNTVLFGGIMYDGAIITTTKFTGGQVYLGDNFTFGTLLTEDRFIIEGATVTVLEETIVSNDSPTNQKVLGGVGTFTGSPTTVSTGGKLFPFTYDDFTFENDLRIEDGGLFEAQIFGPEFDDHTRVIVLGTVTLDNAELNGTFNISGTFVAGDEIVMIDNDGDQDAISGEFEGYPEGTVINGTNVGTLSYVAGDGNDFGWVYDGEAPEAACQDITLNIGLGGVTVTGDQLDGGATDNIEITEILINGQASLDFTYDDAGDHEVTITFIDQNGNSADCMATITINPSATFPILINEYQPATSGGLTQEIEIKGEPGESFAGTFVVIEGISSNNIGTVLSADDISGTFDVNGLLTATIPDLRSPSHTAVLTSSFTGTVGVTDIDTDDDGIVDDITNFGLLLDAIGITNGAICCPIDVIYGAEFGGVDLPYIGGQASAIFREASVGDFYQISQSTDNIYDTTATIVDASIFNTTPTSAGTYGSVNPVRITVDCDNHTTWDGTSWSNGTPDATYAAIINGAYDTATDGNIVACELIINTNFTLTIRDNEYVDIINDITIDGTITVTNMGSVVQRSDDAIVTNNGAISISKTTPTLDDRNFVAMSSPVTSENRDRVYGNSRAVFSIIPSNFVPFEIDLLEFPEFTGAENFLDDDNDYLLPVSGSTALPDAGIGQLVFPQPEPNVGDGAYTITYTQNAMNPGTLNSGTISVPINYNGPATINNYNLLGNPYASAIDVEAFINANDAVNEVYYWDHLTNPTSDLPGFGTSNFSMNDISMRNAMMGVAAVNGGTAPGQFMASGQGFGIKADQTEMVNNMPVVFTNGIRVTGNNDGFRNAENSTIDKLWLNVTTYTFDEAISQTGIGFTPNATSGFDKGYDSKRLGTFLSLFTNLEGEYLAIQGREAFDPTIELILGFSTSIETEENYTISIDHFEGINIENVPVFLIDHLTNTMINLKESNYSFTASKGIQSERFTVIFQDRDVLDTDEVRFRESINLYPNPATNQVTLGYVGEAQLQKLTIIDMNGKVIRSMSLENFQSSQVINTSTLAKGMYFINIQSTRDSIVQKLIIR